MPEDKWKCKKCEKKVDPSKMESFKVPWEVCATYKSERMGTMPVYICQECYEEGWRPERYYMGSLNWRKVWECPDCGKENNSPYCPQCGSEAPEDWVEYMESKGLK